MGRKENQRAGSVAVAVILSMALVAGCLGGGEGYLIQRGSSTVLPLAIAWAEEFDGAQISVAGGGSTHGVNSLLNGEADMATASRLLKDKDYKSVGANPGCWVQLDDRKMTAVARNASDRERAELWPKLNAMFPIWGHFQKQTDRPFPIVILAPTGPA